MGNTFSTSTNTLLFTDPYTEARARLAAFKQHHHPTLETPQFYPHVRLPSPSQTLSTPETAKPDPAVQATLTYHKVLLPDFLLPLLNTLTGVLHTSGPFVLREGFTPATLFHLSGDFANPLSNSLFSILSEKTSVHMTESGEEEITGQHGWMHIYEPGFGAVSFQGWLKDMRAKGVVEEVEVGKGVGVDELMTLEGVALFWPRMVYEGVEIDNPTEGEGKEEEVNMMKCLEDQLWQIWLNTDAGDE
ncbi:hypothetical protein K504DRAFT_10970 [Pleomassaria siparia CBS 279.74]|uniref:Uncharacterized protein n=1 Tax=Pleomassaria siparia CBS 279.74 TaxID=1314801 RepID=A0A6G1KPP4_9PLEO|nr:hypothetical protein K504DRAFT_10970 [Pleomassaria siparia CBS 279.74]